MTNEASERGKKHEWLFMDDGSARCIRCRASGTAVATTRSGAAGWMGRPVYGCTPPRARSRTQGDEG